MTEPQPWPTTTQRRRESGTPGAASDVPGSDVPASDASVSGIATSEVLVPAAREPDISTPRHGHPADAPAAARVPSPSPSPSPFPRQRDAPRAAPQVYSPDPQEPAHSRPTHVRDLVGPRRPEPHTGTSRPDGTRAAAPAAPTAPAAPAVRRDGAAMTTLRVITYVLVSLASVAFLAIVVYGGIKAVQLRDELATSPFGALTGSSASPTAGG